MRYIEGVSRTEIILFPDSLDDYISEDNPVRFIDEYVNTLDLKEFGFTYTTPKDTGRKPYSPFDMLKLYIYGFLKNVRSSRRLEAETQRNIEVMWLLKKLTPDFKTISDFRKDNKKNIKKVHREFIILCKKLDLFSKELVAIDGSKFRACNASKNNFTKNKLNKMIKEIDKKLDEYFNDISTQDEAESKQKKHTAEELKEIFKNLNTKKQEVNDLINQVEKSGETQVSLTDPDSRMMHSDKGDHVSYNVQVVVEGKNHFILDYEVTNDGNDENSLSMMAIKAKEILEVDSLTAVADTGYFNKPEIKKCEDNNIECYVPAQKKSSNENSGRYKISEFIYDKEKDSYTCPQDKILSYRGTYNKGKLQNKKYECRECKLCPKKTKCTTAKRNRTLYRWIDEEIIERMSKRLKENKEMMVKRKSTVEHVFGTIKHWSDQGYFLLRRFKKVSAEMGFAVLAYNIKRAIKILGVKQLIAALR